MTKTIAPLTLALIVLDVLTSTLHATTAKLVLPIHAILSTDANIFLKIAPPKITQTLLVISTFAMKQPENANCVQ